MPAHEFTGGCPLSEKTMTTIVLAEDHHLVREGLKRLLQTEGTFQLVGETGDGLEAVRLVEQLKPNILLLDLMMPRLHGLEVIRQLRRQTATKTIVISMHSDEPYVVEAFRNGASGYVLKDSTHVDLLKAIKTVVGGRRYLSPSLSEQSIDGYLKPKEVVPVDSYDSLTNRERVVLQLTAEGLSSAEVGRRLFISPRTAETHRANIMRKLGLRSQTDMVRFAIRRKIISA